MECVIITAIFLLLNAILQIRNNRRLKELERDLDHLSTALEKWSENLGNPKFIRSVPIAR